MFLLPNLTYYNLEVNIRIYFVLFHILVLSMVVRKLIELIQLDYKVNQVGTFKLNYFQNTK